jgi:hypothetical protein
VHVRGFAYVTGAVLFAIGVGVAALGLTATGQSPRLYGPQGAQFSAAFLRAPTEFHESSDLSSDPGGLTPSEDTFWYKFAGDDVERVDITPISRSGFALSDLTRGYLERIARVTVAGLPGLRWSEGCYLHTYCTEILVVTNGTTLWTVGAHGSPAEVSRFLGSFSPAVKH